MALSRHGSWKKDLLFIRFNAVTRHGIYVLGHKVHLTKNVTLSRS